MQCGTTTAQCARWVRGGIRRTNENQIVKLADIYLSCMFDAAGFRVLNFGFRLDTIGAYNDGSQPRPSGARNEALGSSFTTMTQVHIL